MGKETINRLFEKQVEQTPDNIALVYGHEKMTYAELNREANKRAHYLRKQGVGREQYVGIVMDHCLEMIVNIFAVLKSGAAYIPMEPTFPKERINYIIRQAGICHLFTQRKNKDVFSDASVLILEDECFDDYSDENTDDVNDGSNAIYVLYTSGTTGAPKGVVVEQRNVCNYVKAFKNEFQITNQDKVLQNSVCTFDIFVEELYPILLTGGTLVIANEDEKSDVRKLLDLIDRERITIITGFPYLLAKLNRHPLPDSLKLAISGGDTLRKEHVSNLLHKVCVYNTYGPTETTVCVAYYHYTNEAVNAKTVPIGKPVYGTEIYVLNEKMQAVHQDEIGEICIAGKGVSRGYLGNEAETNKHFIDNPFGEGKIYLSGDLGLLRKDGNVEFMKRKDEQVMIGGKRVEPLEIENVMYRYHGIDTAIVKAYLDEKKYPYLVGYYSAKQNLNSKELKTFLRSYLPDFMIPRFLVKLDHVPKTFNGKIDRRHLPIVRIGNDEKSVIDE